MPSETLPPPPPPPAPPPAIPPAPGAPATPPEAELRSLPPISLLFNAVGVLKGLLVPLVVVLFIGSGRGFELWFLGVLLIPGLAGVLLRYGSFSYRLADEDLILREGIITRNERHVPYQRIQNIDLVQNPFHRLFDVAVVRLETASGGKPEAVISVLHQSAVEELRSRVLAHRSGEPDRAVAAEPALTQREASVGTQEAATRPAVVEGAGAVSPSRPLVQVAPWDLVLLGLISNRGMLVIAALAGLGHQAGLFDDEEKIEAILGYLPVFASNLDLSAWSPGRLVILGLAALLALVAATRLLSVAWVLVNLFGFRLERRGEDLRSSYGLFNRITATIPRRRVQLLSIRQSPLHRLFRRASVQVETAGGGQGDGGGSQAQGPGAARLWLAPMTPSGTVPDLVHESAPGIDLSAVRWNPVAPKAFGRMIRRHLLLSSAACGVLVVVFGPSGLAPLALAVPLAWWHAHRYVRRSAWGLTDHAVLYRSGAWGLKTSAVPFSKVQAVAIGESPFDRRLSMASVRVDTAGASLTSHRVDIRFLERETAHRLAHRLEQEASERSFRW